MTAKERILQVLRGEQVDRVPICTQIPFAVGPVIRFGGFAQFSRGELGHAGQPLSVDR